MATTDFYTIQGALKPNRYAIRCIGGNTDDYVQVDAAAVAATAGNYTKGAITAVIMVPNTTYSAGTILGFGDKNVVEFIEFNIEAGLLTCRCTDNTTAQFVSQEDAIGITPYKWHHVAVVQAADGAGPKFFIDGVKTASTNDTTTDVDEWFNNCDGIDSGRIGAANKAGDDSVTQEFQGFISDVRHYSTSKTDAEIKAIYEYDMNGIGSNDTTNLVNHWDMKDDYVDAGSGADNGTAVSGVTLVNSANEFTARLNWSHGLTLVTADHPRIMVDKDTGYALITDAA